MKVFQKNVSRVVAEMTTFHSWLPIWYFSGADTYGSTYSDDDDDDDKDDEF